MMPAKGKKKPLHDAVLDAALDLAAESGWSSVTMAAVADAAKYPLGDVVAHVPTKAALLREMTKRVTQQVLTTVKKLDDSESAKDRLFDLLMGRFDRLNAHRAGMTAVINGVAKDPALAACQSMALDRAMASTLAAAGIPADGLKGMVKVKGLKAVYLMALRTWLKDESPDMAATMAALDKGLSRADRVAGRVFGGRRRSDEQEVAA